MKTPTHDEIARQAHLLWQDRGCPADVDTAIWLEAEWQVGGGRQADSFTACAQADTAAESLV